MPWYSYFAIFFVLWWLVLFAVLPFGIRSQYDEKDVAPGTERGAPARFSLPGKIAVTTAVTLCVFVVYYVLTAVLGYSFDDIPSFIPTR